MSANKYRALELTAAGYVAGALLTTIDELGHVIPVQDAERNYTGEVRFKFLDATPATHEFVGNDDRGRCWHRDASGRPDCNEQRGHPIHGGPDTPPSPTEEEILEALSMPERPSVEDLLAGTEFAEHSRPDTTPADDREPKQCPRCMNWCIYDGWQHTHAHGLGIGSCEPSWTEAQIRAAHRELWKSRNNVGEWWITGLLAALRAGREAAAVCGECGGRGAVHVGGCTCGAGADLYGHEPGCGLEPCPNGCEYKP